MGLSREGALQASPQGEAPPRQGLLVRLGDSAGSPPAPGPPPSPARRGLPGRAGPTHEDAPTLTLSSVTAIPGGSDGTAQQRWDPGDIDPAEPVPGAGGQHPGDNAALLFLTPTNAWTPTSRPERAKERFSYPN